MWGKGVNDESGFGNVERKMPVEHVVEMSIKT